MNTLVASPRHASWRPFNMIEIILALVIVLVGVVGLMALFPIGQRANQEAVASVSANDAADQFLNYMGSKVRAHWGVLNTIPMTKPGADAEALYESGEPPRINWQNADRNHIISELTNVVFFYIDEDNDETFDYQLDQHNPTRDESGLFLLVQRTSTNLDDFSAVVRVWKTAAYSSAFNAATGGETQRAIPPDAGVTLNVEVSWPVSVPYARRQKYTQSMEVHRPVENEVEAVRGAFRIAEAGKLRVTYHGSDAGWTSALYMDEPEEQLLFASNQSTDQGETFDTEYQAGTTFNFHIETAGQCCGFGTYNHYAYADPPTDQCTCQCRVIAGAANINPNNSPQMEFTLRTPDGRTITRDDLHSRSALDPTGPEPGTYYHGPATYIKLKPKGNGNQNTLLVDGTVYLLENKNVYEITADEMQVVVYNDKIKNGRAMGHWWIRADSDCAQILEEGKRHDDRCLSLPQNRGLASAAQRYPYYDDPPAGRYHGAHDLTTGNPYCLVTELNPGRKWLMRFEDLPGSRADWDYNDVVISVELVVDTGVSASLTGVAVEGTVDLNVGDDWRLSVVRPDGSMITDGVNLGGGYDGPAIAIWMRPRGTGSQSLTVDGVSTPFNNDAMVSVVANAMNVRLYRSGNTWKADIDAPTAFFTVME